MSLLLASQIAVLVSSSDEGVGTVIRQAMRASDYNNILALYVGVLATRDGYLSRHFYNHCGLYSMGYHSPRQ